MASLRVGDAAPELAATAHDGTDVSLAAFRGKWWVLYFYPRSFTPGCTVESKAFRDRGSEIRALGATIVGVSIDETDTQCRFAEHHALGFPLVADANAHITRAWGVKRPLMNTAKRVTFVIDPEGRIAARFHHELRFEKHVDDVVDFLRAHAGTPSPL
jgi:peroxiredoxin